MLSRRIFQGVVDTTSLALRSTFSLKPSQRLFSSDVQFADRLADHDDDVQIITDNSGQLPIETVGLNHGKKSMKVRWRDGQEADYAFVWLRDCAPAARTIEHIGRYSRRVYTLTDLSLEVRPETMKITDRGLEISWPPYYNVTYTSDWLRKYMYHVDHEKIVLDHGVKRIRWGREDMQTAMPRASLCKLRTDPMYKEECYREFLQKGVLVVDGAENSEFAETPNQDVEKEVLALFDFEPINVAAREFTTVYATGMCTGMPLLKQPPKACLLTVPGHVPSSGSIQLVDGLNVAEQIFETHNIIFRYLCEVPVEYAANFGENGEKNPSPIRQLHTVLSVSVDERLEKVVFNNELRSFGVPLSPQQIHKFYAALKTFNGYCYQLRNLVNIKPLQGQMILVHNHRVLHGATAFEDGKSERKDWMHVLYGN